MDNRKRLNNSVYIFSYIFAVFTAFLFGFSLLRFPATAGEGIQKGIEMCVYTLVPSMYPFMFLSSFLVSSSVVFRCGSLLSFLTEKVFKLPGCCGAVILMSMIGGIPVGASMTEEMCRKGYITPAQGKRMMLFCINPGPAFVITTVGHYMNGNRTIGIILYISLVLSSLTIGFLSRFVFVNGESEAGVSNRDYEINLQGGIITAVSKSSQGMMNVCAWIVLFSSVSSLIELLPVSQGVNLFITGISEMTKGCEEASLSGSVPAASAILGFGGICAHLQIMPCVTYLKLPLKYFFCSRIINCGFTVIFSVLIMKALPLPQQTLSVGYLPQHINDDISFPVCIGIMFMCMLFLLGENFRVTKSSKEK